MTDVRAITVKQPWAWAIAHGDKLVENRSRGTTYRGPLAIHAGKGWSDRGAHDPRVAAACVATWPDGGPPAPDRPAQDRQEIPANLARAGLRQELYTRRLWSRGAVIAIAQLVDSHPDAGCCRPWGESEYSEAGGRRRTAVHHLVLEDVIPLAVPIPCRGALGLWRPPAGVAAAAWDTALTPLAGQHTTGKEGR